MALKNFYLADYFSDLDNYKTPEYEKFIFI